MYASSERVALLFKTPDRGTQAVSPGRKPVDLHRGTTASLTAAQKAGLKYAGDKRAGFGRRRHGKKFFYVDPSGKRVRASRQLQRISHLAIPPAWKNVWINSAANGHLQAVGWDLRGRKQYLYHENWREIRDQAKYDRMISFGKSLPRLRRRVARDLEKRGLPREKVLATVIRLMEMTLIRIGNDEYARHNRSYGLTTMCDRHVRIRGQRVTFSFRGKSGKTHVIDLSSRKLAQIVKGCRDLPGRELFQYKDAGGKRVDVTSADVNGYLQKIMGEDFTAKDFRTWAGTVLAARALQEFEKFNSKTEAKRNMMRAIKAVAKMLGNTPAICRRSYVHPAVLNTYLDGTLVRQLQKQVETKLVREIRDLRPEEAAVLMLLQQTLKRGMSRE